MNSAVIQKTFQDYRLMAGGATLLLLAFVVLFMFAVSSMPLADVHIWNNVPWIRRLISAMLGADIGDMFTRTSITSFVFTHPLIWVIVIGFLLTITSGVLAGETDRGTMDLLATLPVSRGRIYASLSFVILLFGMPICSSVWLGVCLGRSLVGWSDVRLELLAVIACHLYAAYVFLACFSLAVSAMCSRRTTALMVCFVVIFYSFVLNLLVAFWPAANKIAFTSFLNYYGPLRIVRDDAWQWTDIGVLLGAAVICWTAGWVVFRQRDLPAT